MIWHAALWTAVPSLTQPNATLDVVEMTLWGHEWQWGYYKHPPLPAWLCELSVGVFGPVQWPLLLAAQAFVVVCFWSAWRFARELLAPWPALASAMLLEACNYYHFSAVDLNNNLPAKAGWALAVLFFYWGLQHNRWRDWLGVGAALTLAFYTKYDAALLVATLAGFLVFHPAARRRLRSPGPYAAFAVVLLLLSPHLVWLVETDFLTIEYIRSRSSTPPAWSNHVIHPLKFLKSQVLSLSGVMLLSVPVLGWRWRPRAGDESFRFHRAYLLAVVLGPMTLALLASVVTGGRLRSSWGAAMFTYAGLLLLYAFQHAQPRWEYRRVALGSAAVGVLFAVALTIVNIAGPYAKGRGSRVHYPGRELAQRVQHRWSETTDAPLRIVGGSWWEAGNVGFYTHGDRPAVYIGMNPRITTWTSDSRLDERGGVLLWPTSEFGEEPPEEWRDRCERLLLCEPIELDCRTGAEVPPVRIGMALVPPAGDGSHHRLANGRPAWLK